jgi:hypothetical protein
MVPGASVRLGLETHIACQVLEHPLQIVTLGLRGIVLIAFRLGMGAYHAMNLSFLPFEAGLLCIQSTISILLVLWLVYPGLACFSI